jgi:uncharacterized phage protein gp47/JayE
MPDSGFITPTLPDVIERVSADVDSNLTGAASRQRHRETRALAVSEAGAAYLLHLIARDLANEGLPDLASEAGVLRWATIFGIARTAAVKATGTDALRFTGVDTTVVPIGTVVTRPDGVELITTELGTIAGGQIDVDAEAVVAGDDGNTAVNVVCSLANPIVDIDSEVTVVVALTGGTDQETIEALRGRVLDRLQQPPQGGSNADYIAWTKIAVPTTRSVWVGANEPEQGEVTIRFIVEPADGDPANALPSGAQIQAVQDYIGGTAGNNYEDAAAPVPTIGARIDVRTITAQSITLEITNLTPGGSQMETDVVSALKAMALQRGRADGVTLELSQFYEAVASAPGEVSHEITKINGIAPAAVVVAVDKFPTIGTVTFV